MTKLDIPQTDERRLSRAQVQHFFATLRLAIHDRTIEHRYGRFTYFFDADAVIRMVGGFEAGLGQTNLRQDLARSLVACGFFGEISMLRPHLLELVDYLAKRESSGPQSSYRERVDAFIAERHIHRPMQELLALSNRAKQPQEDEHAVIADFVKQLRDVGEAAFTAIESVSGPWQHRLKRLYGPVLKFVEVGPQMRELVADQGPVISEILSQLEKKEKEFGVRRNSWSDYRDACALAMLHRAVRRVNERSDNAQIRFYTETELVRTVLSEQSAVRYSMAYDFGSLGGPRSAPGFDEATSPLRDADYLLMRMRFPTLSPSQPQLHDDLEEIMKRVREGGLLDAPIGDLISALRNIPFEGQTLHDVIRDFEDLSFLKTVWVADRIPPDVVSALPEWTDVFSFARAEATHALVSTQISAIKADLESKVAILRCWVQDYQRFRIAAKGVDGEVAEITEPARDLGLARWGVVLDSKVLDDLLGLLNDLGDPLEPSADAAMQRLATLVGSARHVLRDCVFVCAVLWALREFDWIVELIREFERNAGLLSVPAELAIWREAAFVRSRRLQASRADANARFSECAAIVRRVLKSYEATPEDRKPHLSIGVAYVLYHCWRLLKGVRDLPIEAAKTADAWVRRSLNLCEAAVLHLDKDSLPWALAVNHCLYIALESEADVEKVLKYHHLLRSVEEKAYWNGRFADTVGCYYLWQFRRFHGELVSRNVVTADEWERLARWLQDARKYLQQAKAHPVRDIAVHEHEGRCDICDEELRELRLRVRS